MARKKLAIPFNARFVILTLLAVKPDYGLAIKKRASRRTGGLVRISDALLYGLLDLMSSPSEDLIYLLREVPNPASGKACKVYAITDKGEDALREHQRLTNLLQSPET